MTDQPSKKRRVMRRFFIQDGIIVGGRLTTRAIPGRVSLAYFSYHLTLSMTLRGSP